MAIKIRAQKKEVEGKTFYFLPIGSEVHGRPTFILWVSSRLVQKDNESNTEFVEFPIAGAKINKTEKGTLVLKPEKGWNVFCIFKGCGYRGHSEIEIFPLPDSSEVFWFEEYSSPRGNLGVSTGAIVSTTADKVVWRWKRTGRLYGDAPKGVTISHIDGTEQVLEDIEDISELSELID
jgi:hypothetical protein